MKKLLVLAMVVGMLFMAGNALATSYLGVTSWGEWYYDLGAWKTSQNGVSYREIYITEYLTDLGRRGFEQPSNVTVAKLLYIIDCAGNRNALIATLYYDSNGNQVGRIWSTTSWAWKDIVPDSAAEKMKEVACY